MVSVKLHTDKPISPSDLMSLYHDAGWWPYRDKDGILKLLSSGIALGAWEDDVLVGFSRAISDGVFRAYIEDVVVLSSYRNKGLGKLMIEWLLEELKVDVISLFCSEDLAGFYEETGFKKTKQIVMHYKH
ncbi:GNAT family N-acetyltransferase [Paenibacillus sp. ACRRY]|uniref:GNAT family N-acetyltransferase n=1 Tax=Paenibacillus sp. ACRRY TaxID=2918208 RepID=UPI001EF6869D|nr:GNAT family N-acetyltransferase [Paenibacillus sp. ACRRY]MCG7385622.1 GNAT family N-acetyltransferase [Paenibacillus sp. ACRRY]